MNCKPGDMAIIVKSLAKNEGKIVTCLRLLPAGTGQIDEELGPVWEIDKELNSVWISGPNCFNQANACRFAPDLSLRPIRPDETPEESLEAMRLLTQISKEEKV